MIDQSPPASSAPGPGQRRRKYGAAAVDAICDAIRQEGIPERKAALGAGVSSQTLGRWKRQREGVASQLAGARADFIRQRLLKIVGLKSGSHPALDAWLLPSTPSRQRTEAARRGRAK